MATIASQIKRISDSRDILRNKGVDLRLSVPSGTYWDDVSNTYVTTTSPASLTNTDQIDKIAAAFNSIQYIPDSEIEVPILLKKNGEVIVSETKTLDPGFYAGAVIKPYIEIEDKGNDFVIDVQTIVDRSLTTRTGEITPSTGYNYMDYVSYEVEYGSINSNAVGYDNTGVTVEVETSGWLDEGTKKVTVDTSEMTSKVGDEEATTVTSGTTIIPSPTADTILTITKGIYGSNRTLVVQSVASQTQGNAAANDILSGKIAWVNGSKVIGEMPNYGGDEDSDERTPANSFIGLQDKLAIRPKLGYYNNYSIITTDIDYNPTRTFDTTPIDVDGVDTMLSRVYYETIPAGYYPNAIIRKVQARVVDSVMRVFYNTNEAKFNVRIPGWIENDVTVNINAGPAFYTQTDADLILDSHQFVITPAKDANGNPTSYLTQVTVDNSHIYDLLSAI